MSGRDPIDFLADLFLEDVGMKSSGAEAPALIDEDEFARIALDLRRVDLDQLAAARTEQERRPSARLWEVLEEAGAMDTADVLAVFRFNSEIHSYTNRSIGRYFVVECVGEGAGGRVYRAIHQDLLKHVALKVLSRRSGTSRSQLERFRREASTAARLQHPNIVGVHDVGEHDGVHFIAMDFIEGVSLKSWIATDPPRQDWLVMLEKIARAVGHAHEQGVLHRDIKPQNVIVRPNGEPVVVDFGLARLETDETLTQEGAVLGTLCYMAPEQLRGEVADLDARADVYSLGAVLYEVITGAPPHAGRAPHEVLFRAQASPPSWPQAARSQASGPISLVVERCLDPDPKLRYADAGALADDLRRVRAGEPIAATKMAGLVRVWRRSRGRALSAGGAVLLMALIGVGTKVGLDLREENRNLSFAGDVKSGYHLLRARLEPVLVEAELVRYGESSTERRDAVVAAAEAIVADVGDETGVGEAYGAWIRLLVGDPEGIERIESAKTEHGENPFPHLVCAWRHLRRYADAARWPGELAGSLHSRQGPAAALAPHETPEMRGWLESAVRDLERARGTRIWEWVPELAWVEDLCSGYRAYAVGDDRAAVEALERVGDYTDLALEPMLVLAFASCRSGDIEGALIATQRLLELRPGHATALRILSACHKHRGVAAVRSNRDGLVDLLEARRLQETLPRTGVRQGELASIDLAIAFARERFGADPTDDYRRALEEIEEAIAAGGGSASSYASRALFRTRLAERSRDPIPMLEEAVKDTARSIELDPDNHPVRENRVGSLLVLAKYRFQADQLVESELDALHAELDLCVERFGNWSTTIFYRASVTILEVGLAVREGRDVADPCERALRAMRSSMERDPDFADGLYLFVASSLAFPSSQRPPIDEIVGVYGELRRIFAEQDAPCPYDGQLARRFAALARRVSVGVDAARLRAAAAQAWDGHAEAHPEDAAAPLASARLRLSTLPEEPRLRAAWLERALDSLEEAQARNPGSDALPIWRALGFAVLGDVGGTPDLTPLACSRLVLELADEALAREPRAPVARVLRAKALLDLGREAEGEAELQQVGSVVVHGDQEAQIELLNTISWMIVRTAGGEAVAIRRAVHSARVATAVVPGNGFWLNTLGIALYRSGNYEEAMGVLERSDALNATVIAGGHPADSAFLAMAAHQLGRSERARTQLERLRVQAGGPGFSEDPEVAGFMREALALLSGDR